MPPRYLASRAKTLWDADMHEDILVAFIAYYCPTETQYYDIHKIMLEMGHTYTENCFRFVCHFIRIFLLLGGMSEPGQSVHSSVPNSFLPCRFQVLPANWIQYAVRRTCTCPTFTVPIQNVSSL